MNDTHEPPLAPKQKELGHNNGTFDGIGALLGAIVSWSGNGSEKDRQQIEHPGRTRDANSDNEYL